MSIIPVSVIQYLV